MNASVHGAAAVIAAGLARSPERLLSEQCVALATTQGYTRRDARAGLAWAVQAGLVRRFWGDRRAMWHQLASSPQPAGALKSMIEQGCTVSENRRSSATPSEFADYSRQQFAGSSHNTPSTPVSDLQRMIHTFGQFAARQKHNTAGHSVSSPTRRNSPQYASAVGGPARQRAS